MSPTSGVLFIVVSLALAGLIGGIPGYVVFKPIIEFVFAPLENDRVE